MRTRNQTETLLQTSICDQLDSRGEREKRGERQTDRDNRTDRHTYKLIDRQPGRHIEIQTETERHIQRPTETGR